MQQLTLRASRLGALLAISVAGSPAWALMPPQSAQVALGNLPTRVMWAIESNDLPPLAKLSHQKGVRFYPHLTKDLTQQNFKPVRMRPAQIRALSRSGGRSFRWGEGFATGDPIVLRRGQFRGKYLWHRDFSRGKVSFNDIGADDDLVRRFPNAIFVRSSLPPRRPEWPHSWASLTMIFQREGKSWKVSGLASDTSNHV